MGAAFAALWNERLQRPGSDLISVMMQAEPMKQMDPVEFIGAMILLTIGGDDTTRSSMSAHAYGLSLLVPRGTRQTGARPCFHSQCRAGAHPLAAPLAYVRRTVVDDIGFAGLRMQTDDMVALW